jgi:hypothetical protein
MALTKQIDFLNGVVTKNAYIEIANINIDFDNKTANFNVKTYLNKATRDKQLQPIQTEYLYVSDNSNAPLYPATGIVEPATEPIKNFTLYFVTGDTKVNAENYLLTLEKYKDCVTVVE